MFLVICSSTIIHTGTYCDNYHIGINLVCSDRDMQYIKYFISHVTADVMYNKWLDGRRKKNDHEECC